MPPPPPGSPQANPEGQNCTLVHGTLIEGHTRDGHASSEVNWQTTGPVGHAIT
jgi:hypothetical protein